MQALALRKFKYTTIFCPQIREREEAMAAERLRSEREMELEEKSRQVKGGTDGDGGGSIADNDKRTDDDDAEL